jgi:hypothetical protein
MLVHRATKDIPLWKVAYRAEDRYLAPTPEAIADMVKSLKEHGQIEPIVVHQLTRDHYYLICGATRVRAASSLSWKTIRASVVSGTDSEFKIAEIVENLHRAKVTAEQRRLMKERIKELKSKQGAFLAAVEPCKGGRGKTGGLREAARKLGLSKGGAHRLKLPQNRDVGAVSAGDAYPYSMRFRRGEIDRLRAKAEELGVSTARLGVRLVIEGLDRLDEPKRPNLRVVE